MSQFIITPGRAKDLIDYNCIQLGLGVRGTFTPMLGFIFGSIECSCQIQREDKCKMLQADQNEINIYLIADPNL